MYGHETTIGCCLSPQRWKMLKAGPKWPGKKNIVLLWNWRHLGRHFAAEKWRMAIKRLQSRYDIWDFLGIEGNLQQLLPLLVVEPQELQALKKDVNYISCLKTRSSLMKWGHMAWYETDEIGQNLKGTPWDGHDSDGLEIKATQHW